MVTYKVGLGAANGVTTASLVGAIAKQSQIKGSLIGQIRLFNNYSTLELPNNITESCIRQLSNVRIGKETLQLSIFNK